MADQTQPAGPQTPALSPAESIKAKIAVAKPDLAVAGASGGTDSFITKVLHLLVELIPDIVDLFGGHKSAPAAPVSATSSATTVSGNGEGQSGQQ